MAFSASVCAEAFNYLALAGYDTQQMCDTLPTVLNLAAAGDIELASASDMVTDVQHYPHVYRYTYCSNMAKSGMNLKTLQYLMRHSDVCVILNVYTHVGIEEAEKGTSEDARIGKCQKKDGNFGYG